MKTSIISIIVAGLALSAHASPVMIQDRAVSPAMMDDAAAKLDALSQEVQTLSASISMSATKTISTT